MLNLRFLPLALAILSLAPSAFAHKSGRPGHRAPAPRAGQDVLITLLETNDLHGAVYKPGEPRGLSKIATLARRIRAQMPHTLLLDSGDRIQGEPDEKIYEGASILAAMNTMGYDAAASGNHEFDYGLDGAARAAHLASFPTLSANVLDANTGKTWGPYRPYVIKNVGGVRVAIFGLTTLETLIYEWPPVLKGVRFADPAETARKLVPVLRNKEHADVVILLSHLGADVDMDLAESVPGIDMILGGHSHSTLHRQTWVGDTLIAQTGSRATYLGRIDFVVHKSAKGAAITQVNGRNGRWWGHNANAPARLPFPNSPLLALDGVADDPRLMAAYRPFLDKLKPVMGETLCMAREALPGEALGQKETALGNLIADAVRAQSKSEVAMINPDDQNKSGLTAGPVKVGDLYRLVNQYTCQALVTARVRGDKLAACIAAARARGGAPLCFSGIRLVPDPNAAESATRLLQVKGEALCVDKTYTVTGPASVMAVQFLGRPGVEIADDNPHNPTVRDALIATLRGHAPLTAACDGRWRP